MPPNLRFPPLGSLALTMPVYNEAELVRSFLEELDTELRDWQGELRFFLVDDASTDGTVEALRAFAEVATASVEVLQNGSNRGHGPSVARGYEAALEWGADLILQTDSDAPFDPQGIPQLIGAIASGADVAHGVRRRRTDPWFRTALSRALVHYLDVVFHTRSADPNSPIRVFRRDALVRITEELPVDPLVPSLFATIEAQRQGFRVVEVDVAHRPRPGSIQGAAWGPERRVLIPRRLMSFVLRALVQSLGFRMSHSNRGRYDSVPSPLTRETGERLPS